jgi:hydroxyethylthiazole kinase-like uncharacterized protein yjeF
MQKAGLALARLALAVAPHAQTYWIACGPGNNGGDGFAAAYFLKQWGKTPLISYLGNPAQPTDAQACMKMAQSMGISISPDMPEQFDLCIDCLFGIGALRAFNAPHSDWIAAMNKASVQVIAADVPSGLNADTGVATACCCVMADFTLSLLTLKPGLFTAEGRQACGEIWFNDLGISSNTTPDAKLIMPAASTQRAHNTHKGTFGDVAVIGGAQGMTGAAMLAACAALHGGAGRVFVGLLHADAPAWDAGQPELMFRTPAQLALENMTVVAGCGGADAISGHLEQTIQQAAQLVLDADALNHLAGNASLRELLRKRGADKTVLTPHPLEAARLLGCSTLQIQADRILAAQSLADQFNATAVLKGSGTIVAAPGQVPKINTSGNGLLATAGTGDVLAGFIGAKLANGLHGFSAASQAVYRHGALADQWHLFPPGLQLGALTASALSKSL